MSVAVYPGSFDPITLGHLNIIKRVAKHFDKVYVCILVNSKKEPLFSAEARVALIKKVVRHIPNVEVEWSDELTVEYAKKRGATAIVKGVRAMSDFEVEFQQASINHVLDCNIETFFLRAEGKYDYLSSTVVKEMARYGADLTMFAPREIIDDIKRKTAEKISGGKQR